MSNEQLAAPAFGELLAAIAAGDPEATGLKGVQSSSRPLNGSRIVREVVCYRSSDGTYWRATYRALSGDPEGTTTDDASVIPVMQVTPTTVYIPVQPREPNPIQN